MSDTKKPKKRKRIKTKEEEQLFAPLRLLKLYSNGMFVGLAQAALFHPIDILRIRLFFGHESLGSGWSFFNGFGFNLFSTAVKQMAIFPTQDILKDKFALIFQAGPPTQLQATHLHAQFLAGVLAGVILGVVASPLSAIKVPLQASGGKDTLTHTTFKRMHTLEAIRLIYQNFGLHGFFRGGLATVLRDTSWSAIYFPIFRYLQHLAYDADVETSRFCFIRRLKSKDAKNFGCSVISASVAMIASYPLDGSRLWRQHGHVNQSFWYGVKQSLRWNKNNVSSFLAGFVRVPLATAFCHGGYLFLKKYTDGG